MRIVGKYLDMDIIEDENVKEIRLPPEFIKDLVKDGKIEFKEAKENASSKAKTK